MVCYEDDDITQKAGIQLLQGNIQPEGKLPVTVCENFSFGSGIETTSFFRTAVPEEVGMSSAGLQKIDSIAKAAIDSAAIPGCVVLVAKNGKVVYNTAFGTTNYNSDTAEFQFTSLPRSLIQGFTNSSSESDPFLFSSKVTLDGNQLVLTLVEQGTTIVATFERFNNVKNSLVGTWYEVFAEGDSGVTPAAAPDNGRVTFGSDVAAVFYYFLSNSRVMLVFTDLDSEQASGDALAREFEKYLKDNPETES